MLALPPASQPQIKRVGNSFGGEHVYWPLVAVAQSRISPHPPPPSSLSSFIFHSFCAQRGLTNTNGRIASTFYLNSAVPNATHLLEYLFSWISFLLFGLFFFAPLFLTGIVTNWLFFVVCWAFCWIMFTVVGRECFIVLENLELGRQIQHFEFWFWAPTLELRFWILNWSAIFIIQMLNSEFVRQI